MIITFLILTFSHQNIHNIEEKESTMTKRSKTAKKNPAKDHKRSTGIADKDRQSISNEEIAKGTYGSENENEIVDNEHIEEKNRRSKRNKVSDVQKEQTKKDHMKRIDQIKMKWFHQTILEQRIPTILYSIQMTNSKITMAESYGLFTILTYAQAKNKELVQNFTGIRGIYQQSTIYYCMLLCN